MDTLKVSRTLTIEDVELYVTFDSSVKLATKGSLHLLNVDHYNSLILQINDFRYSLNNKIPILVSTKEKNTVRSYVLPNTNGFYIIKVMMTSNLKVLDDLDAILKKQTNLVYKKGGDGGDGDTSTQFTDLDDIQFFIEDGNSPKSGSVRPMSLSVGALHETKSPKKRSLFRSLFSKKSKRNSNVTPNKFDSLIPRDMVTEMNKEYVQGLIMAGKTIGDKHHSEHIEKIKNDNNIVKLTGGNDIKYWSKESYENMNQALAIVSKMMMKQIFHH